MDDYVLVTENHSNQQSPTKQTTTQAEHESDDASKMNLNETIVSLQLTLRQQAQEIDRIKKHLYESEVPVFRNLSSQSSSNIIQPIPGSIMFGAQIWGLGHFYLASPSVWNKLMGRPGAGFGDYVNIDAAHGLANKVWLLERAKELKQVNAFYCITLMPNLGMDKVTDLVIQKISWILAEINHMGVRVLLRPMHEMNGDWFSWGNQPTLFKSTWIRLANSVRAIAPLTSLTWSPNFQWNYKLSMDQYYPGNEYVDWISISTCYYGPEPLGQNVKPQSNLLLDRISAVCMHLKSNPIFDKKPFALIATGVAYHPTNNPDISDQFHADMKCAWLSQALSEDARNVGVSLVMWSEYKHGHEKIGGDCRERDYTLTSNSVVLANAKKVLDDSNIVV